MLRQKNFHHTLSRFHEPVLTIEPGETVVVETQDAFGNQVRTEEDLQVDANNPVAGPIFVQGAEEGDIISVDIKDIKPTGPGVRRESSLGGLAPFINRLLPGYLQTVTKLRITPLDQNGIRFNDHILIPYGLHIGTIGVAPGGDEALASLTGIGRHGGNLDCPDITIGNTIQLPVFVEGAYLFMGDVHAREGDGEMGGGLNCPARCTLTIDLVKEKEIVWPRIISPDHLMIICAAPSIEDAAKTATVELALWLEEDYNLSRWEAFQLSTLMVNLRIGVMISPQFTVVAKFQHKGVHFEK